MTWSQVIDTVNRPMQETTSQVVSNAWRDVFESQQSVNNAESLLNQLHGDPQTFLRNLQFYFGKQWIDTPPRYPSCIRLPEGI